jgi:hypothetical protein
MIVLPSVYFGNIEYFYLLYANTEAQIDVHETYQKQTYRSRCEILSSNGKMSLSIPVIRPHGKDSLMNEIKISNAENWRKDHKKAIESAYRRTPYYEFYEEKIFQILEQDHELLIELNNELTLFILEKIGLTIKVSMTKSSPILAGYDYRIALNPKKETGFKTHRYIQTFEERHGFVPNLSILDLLFNEGPNSISILQESSY